MNSKYNLGIYPFNNAAKILKVDSKNLNSWVKRYLLLLNEKYKNKFYKEVDTERYHNRSIAFLDLIEFRFIKECENRGLRLQEIKKAAQWLIERFETPFPFANEIVLNFLKTNGKHLYADFEALYKISDRSPDQTIIQEVLQPYLLDLRFEEHIASKWYPLGELKHIVLDPKIRFGQPCISTTRIPTETIWELYEAGDSTKDISRLYEIPEEFVLNSIEYEAQLIDYKAA